MDGCKNQFINSMQFRLSASMAAAITLMAIIAGIFSYLWSFDEGLELQDEQLYRLGDLVDAQRIAEPEPNRHVYVSPIDPESRFVVQWLVPAPLHKPELEGIPADLPDGLQTRLVGDDQWRILVKSLDDGKRVLVAQQTEVRDEIARTGAINTLIPLFILIPVVLLLLGYLIRKMFAPLKKMALQLDSNADGDISVLFEETFSGQTTEKLATEIQPFVAAINQLLLRVRESVKLQRQFVRDAAHELRSPLTAISLQAERLVESSADSPLHGRLVNLHQATERTRVLIEQLLTLARAQDQLPAADTRISLKAVLRELFEDLLPLADHKQIEMSVTGEDLEIYSQLIDLQILIKNLIENALRYTPEGGQVEIQLQRSPGIAQLIVKDSGPGIPAAEQVRVFDAFYRVLGSGQQGSGLGLSIVKTIAARLGVQVSLHNNPAPATGLSFCVTFINPVDINP